MDNRRQQLMLAFVTYMDLRQIEDKELRRKLITDLDCKIDELVAKGFDIPEITPERVAALGPGVLSNRGTRTEVGRTAEIGF